jgi:hypothetical protein
MKKLFIILLVVVACSKEDDPDPKDQRGCVTGIAKNDTTNKRVYINCLTQDDYLNGDAGRFTPYKLLQFQPVDKCSDCN